MRQHHLCLWIIVLALASTANAAILYVSTTGDDANDGLTWATAKLSVQAGLNAAIAGDQVWVAKGTYVGCITLKAEVPLYGGFAGTETLLTERPPFPRTASDSYETILDGNKAGSVVTSTLSVTATTRIDGFTIRNGSASSGGGIKCSGGSPTIANNIITGNAATSSSGGGISYFYSSSSDTPAIINNVIVGNSSSTSGGGISCYSLHLTIADNTISENQTIDGGGVWLGGGGLNYWVVANNTITENNAVNGGGVFFRINTSASLALSNTIVAFNSSGIYKGLYGTLAPRSNCVYGNGAYNYSSYAGIAGLPDPTGTNGNISVDPKLARRGYGRSYHIQPDSPCVNAGNDTVVQPEWVDIDSQTRISGTHVDIGADESDGTVWPDGPYTIVRVSPAGNDANNGLSWGSAKLTVQAAINAASLVGGDVWVKAGTYSERITVPIYTHVYGGFNGTETQREQRNVRSNRTILDGQAAGSTVTMKVGSRVSTIDGFTIRNGVATVGGGVYCKACSPTIANNTITANGHGIYCESNSSPLVVNNAIMANTGNGIYCNSSIPAIVNSAILDNTGNGILSTSGSPVLTNCILWGSGGPQVSGLATITYSCVQGGYTGQGNITDYPQLMYDADGILGLRHGSPCIDAGDSRAVASPATIDSAGNPRLVDDLETVDTGNPGDPVRPVVDIGPYEYQPVAEKRLYVNASAVPGGDGLSWATAFAFLRDALAIAQVDPAVKAIWVAAGTYKPDRDAAHPSGTRDRAASFQMSDGVVVYGGFAGNEDPATFDLASRDPAANATILSGDLSGDDGPNFANNVENSRHVVTVNKVGRTSILDGFTIRGGNANATSGADSSGGGIYGSPTWLIISNNTITGNYANSSGGGIYTSWAVILNNKITGNKAGKNHNSASGGGICGSGTIIGNFIGGNSAETLGGGVYASDATIRSNMIIGNAALGYGAGICLGSVYSATTIANNSIIGNTGQGLRMLSGPVEIVNNTIAGNSDCGIYCNGATATISNNIVAYNATGIYRKTGTLTLRNNDVFGNTSYNYSSYSGILSPGVGDISVDPKLANLGYGNVHIQADSPCINAGDDTLVQADWLDIDGQPRIIGTHVDIGADESDGTSWPLGPNVIVRVSLDGNDANDGSSWDVPKRTVQAAIDAASVSAGDVWVKSGTYYERIIVSSFAHVCGGFTGTETQRTQRNWRKNITILDGQAAGSVVTFKGGWQVSTIDGFTIQHGQARDGGGIYCEASSPMIANNLVTGNTASTYGGGVYCSGSSPRIAGNAIIGNTGNYGGGICCGANCYGSIITNNTITNNNGVSYGGGMYFSDVPYLPVRISTFSNIVVFNSSGIHGYSGDVLLRNNNVYGNPACDYSGGLSSGTGDIHSDPLFVRNASPGEDVTWGTEDDDFGDLRLRPASPCVDMGYNAGVPAGTVTDLGGLTRFVDDPFTMDCWGTYLCGTAPIVDMGAYEFQAMPGDLDGTENVNADDATLLAACLSGPNVAYVGDCARADFDTDGDVDCEDFGFLQQAYGE